ncbi:MAG: transposase [Pseudomonadota bacterium]
MDEKPHSKNLRKHRFSQSGRQYVLTTAVSGRRPLFANDENAEAVLAAMRWLHETHRFVVEAAVVMPDHLHLVGELIETDLATLMHTLKSYTAKLIANRGIAVPIWQPGYYDHALASGRAYRRQVRYVLENPIRAGLVSRVDDYPHLILPTWWQGEF